MPAAVDTLGGRLESLPVKTLSLGLACCALALVMSCGDTRPTGSVDAGGLDGCSAGATQCDGNGVSTCKNDGTWGAAVACVDQACVSGACAGQCAPGATTCDGNGVSTCMNDGTWGAAAACVDQACVSGACVGACVPQSVTCAGTGVQTCDADGAWVDTMSCPFACAAGQCTGVCVPASTQCVDAAVETCGTDGLWGMPLACTGEACVAGACTGSCVTPVLQASPSGDLATPLPSSTMSTSGLTVTTCPSGPNLNANPPTCTGETLIRSTTLTVSAPSATQLRLEGTVPFRIANEPQHLVWVPLIDTMVTMAVNGNGACLGGGSFAELPVDLLLSFDPLENNSLSFAYQVPGATVTQWLSDHMIYCGGASPSSINSARSLTINQLAPGLGPQVIEGFQLALCQTDATTCPAGTTANSSGVCLYPSGACAPRPSLFATCATP